MSEPDELYTLRNLFWLGNFQMAINEASGLNRLPARLVPEKQEYVYRSYIGLGQYNIILSEVKDGGSTGIGLRAIKLLAQFLFNPSTKDTIKLQLDEWLSDSSVNANSTLRLVAAVMNMYCDNLKDAMLSLKLEQNLEQMALLVQIYLRINRLDLADKMVAKMKAKDEDAPLTILANAWTVVTHGTKPQDAVYAYEELIDKYGASASLLSGLAVAKMQNGQFEEAETDLLNALTKAPNDADLLANLITVGQHLHRPAEVLARYMSQLQNKPLVHTLISSTNSFDSSFERAAASLSV